MNKVLIIDTSILCVWLRVPGKETCGSGDKCWQWKEVNKKMQDEIDAESTLVLPLASIVETGNHISQGDGDRFKVAQRLGGLIKMTADQATPWAAFTDQSSLWNSDGLHQLARDWPPLASQKLSIGDATIKQVAEHYSKTGCEVEIFTGDEGLKAFQPSIQTLVPRRKK